jgi:hypothetical protein
MSGRTVGEIAARRSAALAASGQTGAARAPGDAGGLQARRLA